MRVRNKQIKLKGFTLIEIIISMILSGILLAGAVKIFLTISLTESQHNRSISQRNDMLLLNTVLTKNFLNSQRIIAIDVETIIFYNSKKKMTIISFQPSRVIVLDSLSHDTLNVFCDNLLLLKLSEDTSLIEKLSFSVEHNKLEYPFFYSKEYTEDILFNSAQ